MYPNLIIISLLTSSLFGQSPTFGYMALGRVMGSQSISIPDLDVSLDNPYLIEYTIEGHYMTDDIYYIGKVFNSAFGRHNYTYESSDYQVINGSVVSFSLGSFSPISDNLGLGFGIRNDFTYYGLSNFGRGKVEGFSWLLGPEIPITYSINSFLRLYGKAAIMNVWNDKVFNGFATDFNLDLHFAPIDYVLIGAGIGHNTMSTNTDFAAIEDDISYKASALYYQFYIGISWGGHTRAF